MCDPVPAVGYAVADAGFNPMSVFVDVCYVMLFIFLINSGYFYKPERTLRENLLRMAKRILIPFLVCIVVLPLTIFAVAAVFPTGFAIDASVFGYCGVFSAFTLFAITLLALRTHFTFSEIVARIPVVGSVLAIIGKNAMFVLLFHLFCWRTIVLIVGQDAQHGALYGVGEATFYAILSIALSLLIAYSIKGIMLRIRQRHSEAVA